MDRWQNKIAVVTGAASGIGEAVVIDLLKNGVKVVGLDTNEQRLLKNQQSLPETFRLNYYPRKCNVSNESEVKTAFKWIDASLGASDLLINCAGVFLEGVDLTKPDNTKEMRDVIASNVMGVVYCVREAFDSMKRRSFDGHVVILNSIFGHRVYPMPGGTTNMYAPSKFALTAMVETYRQEFANAGTKVKVTSISPGGVRTDFVKHISELEKLGFTFLDAKDVSSAILYALGTPPHVQIHELVIKPMGEKI